MKSMIIVNFGGPRLLSEVESFLIALLTDRDVIRTKLPKMIHRWFFTRIAKKRALKVAEDYQLIGGKSPIFEDTEAVAKAVASHLNINILTFHRYLTETHASFINQVCDLEEETVVFPMFPQFSFATTGSIARFFKNNVPKNRLEKMRWVKSYADHPAYVRLLQNNIRTYLLEQDLKDEECILLFSAHGIPLQFVKTGDTYEKECKRSFEAVAIAFPKIKCRLSYQSKFGRGEWLRPYTDEVCRDILEWSEGRRHVIFIPLSFTSDHIETLFEVEQLYMPVIRKAGLSAHRCPAPNRSTAWTTTIAHIAQTSPLVPTDALIYSP
ncbi:MAG: ferrochelatase [Chlamydiota bacterium]